MASPIRKLRSRIASSPLVKARVLDPYRMRAVRREVPGMPVKTIVPLDETSDVLLLCSGYLDRFHVQTHVQELAFAHEMAVRSRPFAVTDDPGLIFDKQVAWFLPGAFIRPRLWDYSRQAYEFAVGLERQGNRLFCSSAETSYWENKAHMHRKLDEIGVPTPRTTIITRENRDSVEFDIEPTIVKLEHSAGSAGIHYFRTSAEARAFVTGYPFRPTESLIMQEVVAGATRDMRLIMVGDKPIELSTYWRVKSQAALSGSEWTTTATKYGATVVHDNIPESVVPLAADYLRKLGVRTAGVDLIWVDDDLSRPPLFLELSPYYQPNPPKPARYADWTYRRYKQHSYVSEGYLSQQYKVFRAIAGELLDQGLF